MTFFSCLHNDRKPYTLKLNMTFHFQCKNIIWICNKHMYNLFNLVLPNLFNLVQFSSEADLRSIFFSSSYNFALLWNEIDFCLFKLYFERNCEFINELFTLYSFSHDETLTSELLAYGKDYLELIYVHHLGNFWHHTWL